MQNGSHKKARVKTPAVVIIRCENQKYLFLIKPSPRIFLDWHNQMIFTAFM